MSQDIRRSTGLAWDRIGRWFFRGRIFRIAIQVRMLTLASLGVLLTIAGWWATGKVFENFDSPDVKALVRSYESCPWKTKFGGLGIAGFGTGLGGGPALARRRTIPWSTLGTGLRRRSFNSWICRVPSAAVCFY
ncbi:MAG: hypothetical protein QM775_17340 [Pirellulales bacterium]